MFKKMFKKMFEKALKEKRLTMVCSTEIGIFMTILGPTGIYLSFKFFK